MMDQDKAKAIERANSYRQMMSMWAWKDYQRIIADRRQDALERMLQTESIQEIQVLRGMVKAIDAIESDVGFILEAQ